MSWAPQTKPAVRQQENSKRTAWWVMGVVDGFQSAEMGDLDLEERFERAYFAGRQEGLMRRFIVDMSGRETDPLFDQLSRQIREMPEREEWFGGKVR